MLFQTIAKMKEVLLILIAFVCVNCGHDYENTASQRILFEKRKDQKSDTLIAVFTSSTGSLDLYYIQGSLTLPPDIKSQLSDPLPRDIKICGNFPKDLIDVTSWNYKPEVAFRVIGKTILADTGNAVGKVPLFYVTEWTKFDYHYNSWTEKGDLGTYPKRKKMVDDIVNNISLKGQTINEIQNLLGQPDYMEQGAIGYKISEEFGSDIDPIAAITLTLKFDQDSIIRDIQIEKWKKKRSR
jgi:hypothetical protein